MAVFYNVGEEKIRPGVYQRYVRQGTAQSDAQDGICAIPVQANWGPLGTVVKNTNASQLVDNYGSGTYGTGYTVPAAAAMFEGGAATVYTYRLGTGGTKASKTLTYTAPTGGDLDPAPVSGTVVITAKYPGTMPISIAVQNKIGYATMKQFLVYAGTTQVESFDFASNASTSASQITVTTNECENLIAAAAASNYVDIAAGTAAPTVVPITEVTNGALTNGANPTVTNANYSTAFQAFEPYYYNCIAIDVNDDENLTLSNLLQEYLDNAYQYGKLGIAVVGEATTVDFDTRMAHAQSFNDPKVVYLGGGWMAGNTSTDGVLSICYTAGVIASTPSNRGITHTVITPATDLCESLTYSQYEDAILAGMLMISMAPDGSLWYDSGINTLTNTTAEDLDNGWKKIRRVKVRFELIDRLDRALAPKVGKVSADSDGISDIIQSGQRVLDLMANTEGKLQQGARFVEDIDNPYTTDSAWFIIQADDIDSLEKIYLQYQFRYSQNS